MTFSSWCVSAKPIQISIEAAELLRRYLREGQEEHGIVLVRERSRNAWLSSRQGVDPSPAYLTPAFCQAWMDMAGSDPLTRRLRYTFTNTVAEGETLQPDSTGCEIFEITMQGVKKRELIA